MGNVKKKRKNRLDIKVKAPDDYYAHEGLTIVEPPIQMLLPDGEYLLRGAKRGNHRQYIVKDGVWYVSPISSGDIAVITAYHYNGFPSLSEREWETMNIHKKRLSKQWRIALEARNRTKVLRDFERRQLVFMLRERKGNIE